tara:strand:+ start:60 stop:1175 length:1116 start_codon:yes stop_codon:yes gene_type:complete
MSEIGYVYAGDVLTVVVRGEPYTLHPNDIRTEEVWNIIEGLDGVPRSDQEKEECLLSILREDIEECIEDMFTPFMESDVTVSHGIVSVRGEPIHGALVDKILELRSQGRSVAPFVKFLANLSENPSDRSREQLYGFLERAGFPLTLDGHFLSYKGVNDDLWDKHTGNTFQYHPGTVIEMERDKVCDDPDMSCAPGIHVGTAAYARSWAPTMILVKVNPRDAVSVPKNETEKLRVCRLEVLRVYEAKTELKHSSYTDEELEDDEFEENELKVQYRPGEVDSRRERYSKMGRDDVCRQASAAGLFHSTNEARDVGKAFVVEAMALKDLPSDPEWREQWEILARRRRLFDHPGSPRNDVLFAALKNSQPETCTD